MSKVSTKRAAIFLNGDLSDLKSVKQYILPSDLIICADGAAAHALLLNLVPNVIIGDFDSLPKLTQNNLKKYPIKLIRFPREKDESDSELAINYAVENNFKDVLIFGLFGSRLDHMLTNIFVLENLKTKGVKAMCVEGKQEIQIVNDQTTLKGKAGDLVSLIPLKNDVKQVTTKGLRYPLVNEDLLFGYSRGISNALAVNSAEISIKNGSLLVIHHKR